MANLVFKDESYKIMGACFEVYQTLGRGFLEPVYQECLEIELADRGIPFVPHRSSKSCTRSVP
jgi:GxxExxY protein